MAKKYAVKLDDSISLKDIIKPKKLVSQSIVINGLRLEIARPIDSRKLPSRFKSLL